MSNSVKRIDRILDLIGNLRDGLTHTQIAKTLGMPKSTLSVLLNALVALEYAALLQPGGRYVLGPRILMLAGRFLDNQDLVQLGAPFLDSLVKEVKETAFLVVKHNLEVVYVSRVDPVDQYITTSSRPGQSAPFYLTAAGKAVLAFLKEEAIDQYLALIFADKPDREEKIPSLKKELALIRETGVAYCREEFHAGMNAFGSPVFGLDGLTLGSLVVVVPSYRLNPETESRIVDRIRDHARRFSHRLGFDGWIDAAR